jgi:hypothetical protein
MKAKISSTVLILLLLVKARLFFHRAFVFLLLSFIFLNLSSQVPQGFNYQAIARDLANTLIINRAFPVRITLQTSLTGGTVVWQETHNVTTNQNGVMSFVIGTGTRTAGSAALFSDIGWGSQPLFLKTELQYPAQSYIEMGTTQLWSVPYSLLAHDLEGPVNKLGINGKTLNFEEALFEVKNNTGQTVFAVYNEGVRVYVDNGAKGAKGGFAIGGFGTAKAASQEYMRVTGDSTRIYINESAAKGAKGGFAIGGFNTAKGLTNNFLKLSPANYFVGHKSGELITTGVYNSTLGFESGKSLTTGVNNIFIGYQSGLFNAIGSSNIFIGNAAGYNNLSGNYNVFLGRSAGYTNSTGWGNIILGDYAGWSNTTGYQNVIMGDLAGYGNSDGAQNVFIGASSGYSNTTGSYNSFLGAEVGKNNTTGDYNTFFGYQAGFNSGLSSYSTSIGYKAGYSLGNWQAGTYVGYQAGMQSTGRQNVFVGSDAGQAFTTGADNVAVGAGAGSSNDFPVVVQATGSRNSFIGYYTGYKPLGATDNVLVGAQDPFGATHINGSYNVYLGVNAGNLSSAASRNVFIGYEAGKTETGSDKLYIQNSSSATPLVWGDFNAKALRFNGNTSINSAPNPFYALQINLDANDTYGLVVWGASYGTSAWQVSDARLKKNILPIENALSSLVLLKGVSYDWNRTENPDLGLSDARQLGLIAQDVEKVLPLAVSEGPGGFKAVDYNKITPVLIEAVKEQQKTIESQKSEIDALKSELAQIKAILLKNGMK